MKTYHIRTSCTCSVMTIVEVDDTGKTDEECEQEAEEIAINRSVLIAPIDNFNASDGWVIEDADEVSEDIEETALQDTDNDIE